MRRFTFFCLLYCTFCILLGVTLFIAIRATFWPNDNKQKQPAPDGGTRLAPGTMLSFDPREPISKPVIRAEPGKPPVIIYPQSRQSTGMVETSNGTGVFIDEGVEWQGKIAYLALTDTLVVADAKTKKTVWSTWISAFWDTLSFEEHDKASPPSQWDVVLRSSKYPHYAQPYDLQTGKKGELRGAPERPKGTPLSFSKEWSGSAGVRDQVLYCLVGSAEEWDKLRSELFGPKPVDVPTTSEVDFKKEMLLVCYAGKGIDWQSIKIDLAVEDEGQILIRLHKNTFQTFVVNTESPRATEGKGLYPVHHPYGLFVLPRREGKPVVLEHDTQNILGGPPFWKEFKRVALTPKQ